MAEEIRIAADLRARWTRAFASRDLDGFCAIYDEDVLFFGSTPQLFRGHAGVRAYFAGLPADVVLEAFDEPECVTVADGVFATAGFWRFRFGAEPRLYRLTWVVAKSGEGWRDGGWRIVQHHAARCDG